MARFSERYGYTPFRNVMQLESMDEPLKNGLWSAFYDVIAKDGGKSGVIGKSSEYLYLLTALWKGFYKLPTDTLPERYGGYDSSLKFIRDRFYAMEWNIAYEFIEFVCQNISFDLSLKPQFAESCNEVLKQEMAGYRFVNDEITQITADEEVAEIEQAINEANANPVSSHLKRALELLSDRTEPDYRNSIKESISAVEALCVSLTGETKLGQALKKLDEDSTIKTHPALNGAFQKLYGYTSDANGIRHSLSDEDRLEFEDAKFMLVSCSAFVNYLQAKAAK